MQRYQTEVELLNLAARGVDPNLSPNLNDFRFIVESLRNRKIVLLFKWFWKHSEVVNFSESFAEEIDPSDFEYYFIQLLKIIKKRESLHWLERINLFHVYGLSRLLDRRSSLKIIGDYSLTTTKNKTIKSLNDISAYNVFLMLNDAPINDSIAMIDLINTQTLLAEYGLYQLYYYGGISQLIDTLKLYIKSPKEVIIPQTLAGLFAAEPKSLLLGNKIRQRIYDEILYSLPNKVQLKLEKIDKRRGASFKITV